MTKGVPSRFRGVRSAVTFDTLGALKRYRWVVSYPKKRIVFVAGFDGYPFIKAAVLGKETTDDNRATVNGFGARLTILGVLTFNESNSVAGFQPGDDNVTKRWNIGDGAAAWTKSVDVVTSGADTTWNMHLERVSVSTGAHYNIDGSVTTTAVSTNVTIPGANRTKTFVVAVPNSFELSMSVTNISSVVNDPTVAVVAGENPWMAFVARFDGVFVAPTSDDTAETPRNTEGTTDQAEISGGNTTDGDRIHLRWRKSVTCVYEDGSQEDTNITRTRVHRDAPFGRNENATVYQAVSNWLEENDAQVSWKTVFLSWSFQCPFKTGNSLTAVFIDPATDVDVPEAATSGGDRAALPVSVAAVFAAVMLTFVRFY